MIHRPKNNVTSLVPLKSLCNCVKDPTGKDLLAEKGSQGAKKTRSILQGKTAKAKRQDQRDEFIARRKIACIISNWLGKHRHTRKRNDRNITES